MKKVFLTLSILLLFVVSALAYIGNRNTHIFHYDSCSYVARMNSGNKIYFNSKAEAIDNGFRPCRVCNP